MSRGRVQTAEGGCTEGECRLQREGAQRESAQRESAQRESAQRESAEGGCTGSAIRTSRGKQLPEAPWGGYRVQGLRSDDVQERPLQE